MRQRAVRRRAPWFEYDASAGNQFYVARFVSGADTAAEKTDGGSVAAQLRCRRDQYGAGAAHEIIQPGRGDAGRSGQQYRRAVGIELRAELPATAQRRKIAAGVDRETQGRSGCTGAGALAISRGNCRGGARLRRLDALPDDGCRSLRSDSGGDAAQLYWQTQTADPAAYGSGAGLPENGARQA